MANKDYSKLSFKELVKEFGEMIVYFYIDGKDMIGTYQTSDPQIQINNLSKKYNVDPKRITYELMVYTDPDSGETFDQWSTETDDFPYAKD